MNSGVTKKRAAPVVPLSAWPTGNVTGRTGRLMRVQMHSDGIDLFSLGRGIERLGVGLGDFVLVTATIAGEDGGSETCRATVIGLPAVNVIELETQCEIWRTAVVTLRKAGTR